MDLNEHIKKVIVLMFVLISTGVIGFMIIEDWPFLEALYMTVITLSTVGYRELHELSDEGIIFLIFFIVLGVGTFFYIITTTAQYLIEGHLAGVWGRRKMKNKIDKFKGHYIICGFGRVGEEVAKELELENRNFVVIESREERIKLLRDMGYAYIEGDASDDDILIEAGIMRAKGLVSCAGGDADNVFITLGAKNLNPQIFIVARASNIKAEYKLKKAGADRMLSPFSIGGKRLASMLTRPLAVDYLDVVLYDAEIEVYMEEVPVHKASPFIGLDMAQARTKCVKGANILALKKHGKDMVIGDKLNEVNIDEDDIFVAIGTKKQLKELEGMA